MVYAIPKVFVTHQINLEKVFEKILYLEELSLDVILDTIFASKACKTSIKAGHKLTLVQMENLVRDGFLHIEGMFVCQHGRPFFIEVKKTAIDSLFDR